MTERAQIAVQHPPRARYAVINRTLKLPQTTPFTTYYTVYAKALDPDTEHGPSRVGFALEENATEWYTKGVRWKFKPDEVDYGLFICFVLVEGIEELELPRRPNPSPLWFSTTWTPSTGDLANQMCCAPPIAGARTRYHFRTKLANGEYVDPIIIVTPINTTDENDVDAEDDDPRSAVEDSSLLVLTSTTTSTFTVHVKISNGQPFFTQPPQPAEFSEGVQWMAPKAFSSVSLTFVFVGSVPITSLVSNSSGLTFTQPVVVNGHTQQSCQLPRGDNQVQYDFTVEYSGPSGERLRGSVDPIIIVTPINTTDD